MSVTADQQEDASGAILDTGDSNGSLHPTLENHRKLADWVVQRRGFIHPYLKLAYDASKGFHGVVEDGKTLPAHIRIASCPMTVTISVLNVLDIAPFESHGTRFPKPFLERYQLATHILQSFFLMEQYILGEKSWWALYVQTLPTLDDVNRMHFEDEEDVLWIRGTNLEAAISSQSRKWRNQFEEANSMLAKLGWDHAKNGDYNYELFRWASSIFGSRSFTSLVLDDTTPADIARPLGRKDGDHKLLSKLFSERFAVLLPLLDVLNHRPSALVEWQTNINYVGLQVNQEYTSRQEVYNNYGPRDNEGLLMSYGFVLEDNPFEHVLISVNAHPGTPLEMARSWPKDDRSNDLYNCYIFDINHPIVKEAKFLERALFSYDLLDSISVMISNDREIQVMEQKHQTLMSQYLPNLFEDFRNILATLAQIMYDSHARAKRIEDTTPSNFTPSIQPQSQKQRNALVYRRTQVKILRAAEGVCAFALLHAATDQQPSDLLLSMQIKFPQIFTPQFEDICTRLTCFTRKNELFTASALIALFPSPTANSIGSCLRCIEAAILESTSSHLRHYQDRNKTRFATALAALCCTARTQTQLPARLTSWFTELSSSYPPEDPNWSYVPPPGPYAPGEEPPQALMVLLGAASRIVGGLASNDATRSWLEPKMICWAWNVMEEEGIRVPVEIEQFVSDEPAQVDGAFGFLIYCKDY